MVIPCYRVVSTIDAVLASAPQWVERIYCIDDCSPDGAGEHIKGHWSHDQRVVVARNPVNLGVGGAVVHGYRLAMADGIDIVVKVDGDDQMDMDRLPALLRPIGRLNADYAKGNRFNSPADLQGMPTVRKIGNAVLSFMAKLSTGYWSILDPTNGYTAISRAALEMLPLEKLAPRYFFETDMLFRLGTIRAVVADVPIPARYQGEESGLKVRRVLGPFLAGHARSLLKRIAYRYFVRDFTAASAELVAGVLLLAFGVCFGLVTWFQNGAENVVTPTGTVMISVLPIILGFQLLLAWLNFDTRDAPTQPLIVEATERQSEEALTE